MTFDINKRNEQKIWREGVLQIPLVTHVYLTHCFLSIDQALPKFPEIETPGYLGHTLSLTKGEP